MAKIDPIENDPALTLKIYDLTLSATTDGNCVIAVDAIDREENGELDDPASVILTHFTVVHAYQIQKIADYFADVFGIVGKRKDT